MELEKCYFCDLGDLTNQRRQEEIPHLTTQYDCPRCGHIFLQWLVADDLMARDWYRDHIKRKAISATIRNEYERRGRKPFTEPFKVEDLQRIAGGHRPLDPLEKLDHALLNIDRASRYIGYGFSVDIEKDYPYYHCFERAELSNILDFLIKEGFIDNPNKSYHQPIHITPKGYERIRELKVRRPDSRQCFVAMWFTPDMDEVYDQAIRPAIEYVEEGEPRFKALNIGLKDHTNDINDEIIAEIRRSRFMVCDLTGYRGGVYWEAGFAYGLGLEVIYTCQEDWVKRVALGKMLKPDGTEMDVHQEGIHFDLEHRNRLEWSMGDLPGFRRRLEQRIRAVIL
ncbi:MAG: hypothetical protein AB1512_05060 [Thermodesulfobacteriota bacterium]